MSKVHQHLREAGQLLLNLLQRVADDPDATESIHRNLLLLEQAVQAAREEMEGRLPRQTTFAIGCETSPGEFGMTHGPVPDLREMLAVHPTRMECRGHRVFVIRFGGSVTNPTREKVAEYDFNDQRWQEV